MFKERTPFVFESPDREPVEKTLEILTRTVEDRVFSLDFHNGKWYIFEVEDEDEI